MATRSPRPFLLERWFAEFEFIPAMRNLAASGTTPPSTGELLALDGPSATARYLDLGLNYIENPGAEDLRRAIAALHGLQDPQAVQVTTGASEALLLLIWTLLEPGDNLVVEEPCYGSPAEPAAALGAEVRRLRLRPEDGWQPDPERLAGLLDRRTRLVVLNRPHNPSGSTLRPQELAELIRVCERAGAIVISDEVFRPIALEGEAMPSAVTLSERAVAVGDLSKPWGLGGLRVGWVAGRAREILQQVSEARDYTTMCCGAPSEFLAELALRHSAPLLALRLEEARANLAALAAMIDGSAGALHWQRPTAGYTAWVRLPPGLDAEPFCRRLAQDGVLLLPGHVFGPAYHAYVRIGFGCPSSTFAEGLAIMGHALALG